MGLRTHARIQSDTPERREKEADISSEQAPGTETVRSMPKKQKRGSGKENDGRTLTALRGAAPVLASRPEDTVEDEPRASAWPVTLSLL
jgi:hypothetical protein